MSIAWTPGHAIAEFSEQWDAYVARPDYDFTPAVAVAALEVAESIAALEVAVAELEAVEALDATADRRSRLEQDRLLREYDAAISGEPARLLGSRCAT